jgi:hypothetical protein
MAPATESQGEDVVSGTRNPETEEGMARAAAAATVQLKEILGRLEPFLSAASSRESSTDEHRDLAMREDLDRLAAEDDRRDAVATVRRHDD